MTRLKITGIDVVTAGRLDDGECEDIVLRDPARGVYRRIAIRDGRIIGFLLFGDTADSLWFLERMQTGADITPLRDRLVFGPAEATAGEASRCAAVAALPEDAEICGCNGVSKGAILAAIAAGAHDLAAVRAKTRASASCGSCSGLVAQLLTLALGAKAREPEIRPHGGGGVIPVGQPGTLVALLSIQRLTERGGGGRQPLDKNREHRYAGPILHPL